MRFKYMLIFLIVASCSDRRDYKYNNPSIGQPIDNGSNYYSEGDLGFSRNTMTILKDKELVQFSKEPFEFKGTISLPNNFAVKSVLSAPTGAYMLLIGHASYGILKNDGSFNQEPVPMIASVRSVAYDAPSNTMILQGTYDSIVILKLTDQGDVESSCIFGYLLQGERITSGNLINNNLFAMGTEGGKVYLVDLQETLANKEWAYEQLKFSNEESILWVAYNNQQSDTEYLWIHVKDHLFTYDLKEQIIVNDFSLEGYNIKGFSARELPHMAVVGKENGSHFLLTAEGAEVQKTYVPLAYENYNGSLIDAKCNCAVLYFDSAKVERKYGNSFSDRSDHKIFIYRLGDGLPLFQTEIDREAEVIFHNDYFYVLYPSDLGYVEKWNYVVNQPEVELKMFLYEQSLKNRQ